MENNKSITFGKAIDSNILSLSKAEILDQANQILKNFDVDMLETITTISLIRKAQLLIDTLEKGLKEKGINELQKAGGRYEANGCEHQLVEAGVKYDYSVCNDPVYNKLKAQLTVLEDEIKAREKYLKAIPSQGVQTLLEDEVLTLYPPAKSSTTSITVNLK